MERIQLRSKLILGRVLLRSELQKIKASVLGNLIQYRQQLRGQLVVQRNELVDSYLTKALQHTSEYLKYLQSLATMTIENNRIAIVAKKEQNDVNIELDVKDELWDFELLGYAGNLMASISGGTTFNKSPSVSGSAIGGALSGAATGALVGASYGSKTGTAWGAGIGAVIGGIAGAFQ
jgi:hypothetical protein